MTRINAVTNTLYGEIQCPQLNEEEYIDTLRGAARALDAAGHLAPDLPEPDEFCDWGIDPLVVRIDTATRNVCLEDIDPYEGQEIYMSPDEAREVAYALLAAANYAEEHANDQ